MAEMKITRRGLAGLAMGAGLSGMRTAAAQGAGKLVVATWGGGVGDTWREAFGKPFEARSKIPVTVSEVAEPSAQVRAQAGAPQLQRLRRHLRQMR